jgi:type IV secretion system protein VirB9
MVCAPLRVCAVELQAGEHLQSEPQIGDSRRWEITPVMSGSGLDITPLLIVKPIEAGLETDLIVPTDRRTYVLRLVSDPTRFVSRLAFQYPGEDKVKWATFQAQQDAAKRDADILAAQERAKDKQAGVVPMADDAIDNLYFDYKLSGDAAFRPDRVLDDGQHTYLIYPNDGRFRELPTLLMVVNGKTELVNFRVDGSRYIVDRLFDKAVLVVGVGKKQTRVTITRATPYSGSTEKRN